MIKMCFGDNKKLKLKNVKKLNDNSFLISNYFKLVFTELPFALNDMGDMQDKI